MKLLGFREGPGHRDRPEGIQSRPKAKDDPQMECTNNLFLNIPLLGLSSRKNFDVLTSEFTNEGSSLPGNYPRVWVKTALTQQNAPLQALLLEIGVQTLSKSFALLSEYHISLEVDQEDEFGVLRNFACDTIQGTS